MVKAIKNQKIIVTGVTAKILIKQSIPWNTQYVKVIIEFEKNISLYTQIYGKCITESDKFFHWITGILKVITEFEKIHFRILKK